MQTVYLDNAATTRIAPEVLAAMQPFLEESFGNPSSRHPLGVRGREALETARRAVAQSVGAREEGVVFTSGGTESNNLAVLGLARAGRRDGRHVLFGATEHPSVREAALALVEEGFEVESLRLDSAGALDVEDLADRLRADTVLVAQMFVNNEFGSVYPVERAARIVRANAPHARVHVDAVQGLGKLPVSLTELGAHSLALSAHKFHGPKGVGALILDEGVRPRPLVHGGGQERDLRSGTENVAGIVGLARALELAVAQRSACTRSHPELRRALASGVDRVAGARLLEPDGGAGFVPSIAAVLLTGPPAEVWMHHLEARGVMTSVGSACQAQKGDLSPALLALGLDEEGARQVLRISFSRDTRLEEVESLVEALLEIETELGATAR